MSESVVGMLYLFSAILLITIIPEPERKFDDLLIIKFKYNNE